MEECINDIFLSIWNNSKKFHGDKTDFRKWICAIAKFKAIDYYRKAIKKMEFTSGYTEVDSEKSAEDELIILEDRKELLQLINLLEPVDRDIFIMKYFLGLKNEDISIKLGLTKASIDNRIYRGKKKLNQKATNLKLGGSIMKDIYELLNDMDIDETEFKEMEVTELEKAKVKRSLKKSISKKKKMKRWQKKCCVASIIFGLSAATIGFSFTASAKSIPLIGDIFSFLGNGKTGLYDDYKDYSNEIGLTEESNGLTFTINDAIYDGKTVTITYTIESEEDLGMDHSIFAARI